MRVLPAQTGLNPGSRRCRRGDGSRHWAVRILTVFILPLSFLLTPALASDFVKPWEKEQRALVLDAYELNALDWPEIVKDRRIVGFIAKASDGLSPKYCSTRGKPDCGLIWRKYAIARELYHTRRQLAKALGLKWGAYHLGRPGNPYRQAMHFIRYAKPQADEAIVLDIEGLDSEQFMSLSDAALFIRVIHEKLGRYPMLYTNHETASYLARHRDRFPLLSRLKLWYARYQPSVRSYFPMGNWPRYTLWQFSYGGNCDLADCPYRVNGAPLDIDVNVAPMTPAALRLHWPLDGLEEAVPLPQPVAPATDKKKVPMAVSESAADRNAAVPVRFAAPHGVPMTAIVAALEAAYRRVASMRGFCGRGDGASPETLETC